MPVLFKSNYLECVIEKVESFVKSLRWKAVYFYKEEVHHESEIQNFFGFKSPAAPLQKEHFNSFEN